VRKPIILVLALLALIFMAGTAQARAAKRVSHTAKIHTAKTHIMEARHSLYWITTHLHSYKNTRQYHYVIQKQRNKLFHWRALLDKFRGQARAAYLAALPPHYGAWMCIHRYEGSWRDTGAPYYGGLQMDWGFMRTYGGWLLARKGTADKWTPMEQMWVAEKALQHGRGFFPWPNSARMCGLI
jgi:hypothetical protein